MPDQAEVKYTDVVGSFGRNRYTRTIGLDLQIQIGSPAAIVLRPITSRGTTSQGCYIEVPCADIPALIRTLRTMIRGTAHDRAADEAAIQEMR